MTIKTQPRGLPSAMAASRSCPIRAQYPFIPQLCSLVCGLLSQVPASPPRVCGSPRLVASYREQHKGKKSFSFPVILPKFPRLDFHGRLDQASETKWLEFSDWLRVGHTQSSTCEEMVPVPPNRQLVPSKRMGNNTGKMDMKQTQPKTHSIHLYQIYLLN